MFFFLGFSFEFFTTSQEIGWGSVCDYLVSSGMLNGNSINQL